MLIQEKIGHIDGFELKDRQIDLLPLEWYETEKRILRKHTLGGKDIGLKFMRDCPGLQQGDIVYEDDRELIVIDVLPCEVIVIHTSSVYQLASVCYEIGNKHLPLFIDGPALLVPWEAPLFRQLETGGYDCRHERRRLLHPLKTSVAAHGHDGGSSLLSRILQLRNPSS